MIGNDVLRPAEHYDLMAYRAQRQLDADRFQEGPRPRTGGDYGDGRLDPSALGQDGGHAPAGGLDSERRRFGQDARAERFGGVGVSGRRGVRIGVSRIRLIRERLPFAGRDHRRDFADVLDGDQRRIHADRALHLDVRLHRRAVFFADNHKVARLDVAGRRADNLAEVPENVQTVPRQPGGDFVGVVHPQNRLRPARGAAGENVALQQNGVGHAALGEVVQNGAPHNAPAYDDRFRCVQHGNSP